MNGAKMSRALASSDQRRLLNHLVYVIAEYTGHDFREIKHEAKLRALRRGYPLMMGQDGAPVIPEQGESETRITTSEASMLIEELYQLAAEIGALV